MLKKMRKNEKKFKQGPKKVNFGDSKLEWGGGACTPGTPWIYIWKEQHHFVIRE